MGRGQALGRAVAQRAWRSGTGRGRRFRGHLDWLARAAPSGNSVRHHAHIRVARLDRPPGGLMRSHSMQVMAVEYDLAVLVRRQYQRNVVVISGRQRTRAGNHAFISTHVWWIRVIDVQVRIRIRHQLRELVDPDDLEVVLFRRIVDYGTDIGGKCRPSDHQDRGGKRGPKACAAHEQQPSYDPEPADDPSGISTGLPAARHPAIPSAITLTLSYPASTARSAASCEAMH